MRFSGLLMTLVVMVVAACSTSTPPPSDSTIATEAPGYGGVGGPGYGGAGGGYGGAGGYDVAGAGGSASALAAQRQIETMGDTVYFGVDKYALEADARATVDRQAAFLAKSPGLDVVIEGHADERGTREYNLALGERRANSVKEYLVALGVKPARISTISFGEERPAVANSSEAAWAKNRRAVTVIAGAKPGV